MDKALFQHVGRGEVCSVAIQFVMMSLRALEDHHLGARQRGTVLGICFLSFCLQFQFAMLASAKGDRWPLLMLDAGCLGVGAGNPWAALFAFTIAVPLLGGLHQTAFLSDAFSPTLCFSALWTGMMARHFLQWCMRYYSAPRRWLMRTSWTNGDIGSHDEGSQKPQQSAPYTWLILAIVDVLIVWLLLSLGRELWRHKDSAGLLAALFMRPLVGYGDPWYFLASAFIWLQGLFYFRMLFAASAECPPECAVNGIDYTVVMRFVRSVLAAYSVEVAVFFIIQLIVDIPQGWAGAGFQAPYEDISSFGSITAAILIFGVATLRNEAWPCCTVRILSCILFLVMVVASWSRGSWLAAIVFLLAIAVLRLPRLCSGTLLLIAVAAVLISNSHSNSPFWAKHPYLARFGAFVRLSSEPSKDPAGLARLNLYRKAARMIEQHPLDGWGIGSFYRTSARFPQANDPYSTRPDFAHNAFLQIAVEEGLPIAAVFLFFVIGVLLHGLCTWRRRRAELVEDSNDLLLVLGVTLALGAYLETQMTANSLNIYVSNQFFFWFLIAATLASCAHEGNGKYERLPLT